LSAHNSLDYVVQVESALHGIMMGLKLELAGKGTDASDCYKEVYTDIQRMEYYAYKYFAGKTLFKLREKINNKDSWRYFFWNLGEAKKFQTKAFEKYREGRESYEDDLSKGIAYYKQCITDSLDGINKIEGPTRQEIAWFWLKVIAVLCAVVAVCLPIFLK